MLKIKKLDAKGIAHHIFIPLLAISLIAGAGAYVVSRSKAATLPGLVYTQQENKIYSMLPDGTLKKEIPIDGYYQLGPVNKLGNKLLLTAGGNLFTVGVDGSNIRQLTNNTTNNSVYINKVAWSPDGAMIVYDLGGRDATGAGYSHIYRIDSNGQNQVLLSSAGAGPTWSPDGAMILYAETKSFSTTDGGNEILGWHTMSAVDGSNKTPLNMANRYGIYSWNYTVLWPSQEKIVFIGGGWNSSRTLEENETSNGACSIFDLNLNTGSVKQLFKYENFACTNLSMSPDKTTLVFSMFPWTPTGGDGLGSSSAFGDYQDSKLYRLPAVGGGATYIENSRTSWLVSWGDNPTTYAASCTVEGLPLVLARGQVVSPTLKVTNESDVSIDIAINANAVITLGGVAQAPVAKKESVFDLAPGATGSVALPTLTAPYATKDGDSIEYTILNGGLLVDMGCSSKIALPTSGVSLNAATVSNYGAVLTLAGNAAPGAKVDIYVTPAGGAQKLLKSVTALSTGVYSTTTTVTGDATYLAKSVSKSSASVLNKIKPLVSGAASRTVTKGTNTTISGRYTPGKKVTIYMRKPTDPSGTYPTKLYATANSSGVYSVSVRADTKKAFYVQSPSGVKTTTYVIYIK